MKISQKSKNFFLLGWGMGAVGFLGYNYTLNEKKPTPITPQILQNSAVANTSPELHYKFKDRKTHLTEISQYTPDNQNKDSQNEYDLIVIGGGANGSGVFLEAASRGLKCLLLEADDFAAGTSSKSTKLIHGGIRYLEQVFEFSLEGNRQAKFDLVKEALKERTYMVENGYYMNKNVPIVIPSTSLFQTMYYYAGTVVYHLIYLCYADKESSYKFKFPVIFGKNQLQQHFPLIDDQFKYGVVYQDGQFNDTRMTMDLLLTGTIDDYVPKMKGGNLLNYSKVIDLIKNPETQEIEGVEFIDTTTGKQYKVKSKAVCSCTGTFGDEIRKMDDPNCGKRILAVGGSHLVLPQQFGSKKYGLLIPKTQDGRVLFCLPWERHQIVGTTEKEYDEPVMNPTVSFDEMLLMVQEISKLYPKVEVQQISNNIKSKWCGLRPLILEQAVKEGDKIDTKSIARKHVIERSKNNLFSLMGGKWSTYRSMAEQTVDEICHYLRHDKKVDFSLKYEESQTKKLRLSGEFVKDPEFNYPTRRNYMKFFYKQLMEDYEFLEKDQAKYLVKTYGDKAFDIMKLCRENPQLREQVHNQHPFLKAEIIYHIRNEMAVNPLDVIFRRTRLGFIDRVAIHESLPNIIELFGNELGWDNKQKASQYEQTKQTVMKYEY